MLMKRIVVALVAIPLLYLYITALPPVFFLIFLAALSALAQHEFYAMYRTTKMLSLLGITAGMSLLASAYFVPVTTPERVHPMLFIVVFISISSARLFAT